MSTTIGARDVLLAAASPRLLPLPNSSILLEPTTPVFHYNGAGVADPTSIQFIAKLISIEGTVAFGATNGATLTSIVGNTCALLPVNMPNPTTVVTATITYRGTLYSSSVVISKVVDGTIGADGARGAGTYYATGASWSDAAADAATPGANVLDDVVSISNGSSFVTSKRWNGSAWVALLTVLDGNLLVNGSVSASAITTPSLAALSSNFGTVDIATGGYLRSGQSAYNTGTGFWLGSVSGVPKFSIGNSSGANVRWDGTTLIVNNASITSPTFDAFTVSGSFGTGAAGANGSPLSQAMTASGSGGAGGYTYIWSAERVNSTGSAVAPTFVLSTTTGNSCTITVNGPSNSLHEFSVTVQCIDSNKRATSSSGSLTFTFGTPP